MNNYVSMFVVGFVVILIGLSIFFVNMNKSNSISKQQAKITTNYGEFTIEFLSELAPKMLQIL